MARTTPALELRPFHVIDWLDGHPARGPTDRRNATAAIQRASNWAEELGHIAANPVRKIKNTMAKRREEFVRFNSASASSPPNRIEVGTASGMSD